MSLPYMTTTATPSNPETPWVGFAAACRLTVSFTIALLAISLNSVNLHIQLKNQEIFGEITTFLLALLAISDISVGICLMLNECFVILSTIPGRVPIYCKIAFPAAIFLFCFTLMTIVIITLNKVTFITFPFRYPRIVTKWTIGAALIFGVIISLTFAIICGTLSAFRADSLYCMARIGEGYSQVTLATVMALAVFLFLIVVINTYLNCHLLFVACRARKKANSMIVPLEQLNSVTKNTQAGGSPSRPKPSRSSGDFKALRTVIIITASFYLSMFPLAIRLFTSSGDGTQNKVAEYVSYSAFCCNSFMNPIIYFLTNSAYRKRVMLIVKRE